MDTFLLEAESRPQGVSATFLRNQQKIPAELYGNGIPNIHLALPRKDFSGVFRKAGETNLVDLNLDGGKKKFKVLIHTLQLHPVSDEIIHVDLINVRMDQKITTRVPVKLVGVAPVVKEFGGLVSIQMHEIDIRCLPSDLIHEIVVDISGLKTFRDSIHINNLPIPEKIEILSDKSRTVVSVLAPKKEEEVASVAAAVPVEGAAAGADGTAGGAPVAGGATAPEQPVRKEEKKEGRREEKKEKKEAKKK